MKLNQVCLELTKTFKLLTTQNELNQQQMISLAKLRLLKRRTRRSLISMEKNTIKFPTFSGGGKEDVNDLVGQVNLTASFYKLSGFQKAYILHEKSFDTIGEALVTQFCNESDRWLLRQKFSNRKQTENESVTEFASEIQ